MTSSRTKISLTLAALAVGVAAPLADAARVVKPKPKPGLYDRSGGAPAFKPTPRSSWTARLIAPTRLRLGPSSRAALGAKLSPDAPYAGGPQVFLVLDARKTADGVVWYRVLLPSRPNGTTGWVPGDLLAIRKNPWRVKVNVGRREAQLLRSGRVMNRWKVAVGRPSLPTPTGTFAISEIVPQVSPSGFYGPFIITLTAHSTRLNEFDGGDGRVALHGTSQPQFLGTAASHGCVRLPNEAAGLIASRVPAGTPVEVAA
jgi:hypothetical protein